jgi:hypothetical protein
MPTLDHAVALEEQIDQWRSYLRRQAIHSVDVAELEDHLREQVAALVDAGLATDEAFLVAVKRMGNLDALSRDFAREHSNRLWKQLVVVPSDSGEPRARARMDAIVAFCLAVAAAVAIKIPALFGIELDQDTGFYVRNLSLFVLPFLTIYFAWKRRLDTSTLRWLAVAFVAAGVVANVYPFAPGGFTEALTALHLPIALWLVVGIAYAGGRWSQVEGAWTLFASRASCSSTIAVTLTLTKPCSCMFPTSFIACGHRASTRGSYGITHSRRIQDLFQRRASAEGRDAHDSGGDVRPARSERCRQVDADAHSGHIAGAV